MLLRTLMTICTLGADWKDASKIPVAEIIEEWRAHEAKRWRYENKMWTSEALEAAADAPSSSAAAPTTAPSAAGDQPVVRGPVLDLT